MFGYIYFKVRKVRIIVLFESEPKLTLVALPYFSVIHVHLNWLFLFVFVWVSFPLFLLLIFSHLFIHLSSGFSSVWCLELCLLLFSHVLLHLPAQLLIELFLLDL